jgi:hypothetical protein
MTDPKPTRIAFLKQRLKAREGKDGPTDRVPFRQKVLDLPRIEVPIDFPLYNLRSGRSHRAQSRYVERNEFSSDFFEDPESEAAQTAQGKILLEMIDLENLRADLEDRKQRQSLVLTYDGVIVDGNRRTAALRTIGEAEQLAAVVLPEDAEAADIYDTELELQMSKETKAAYNWVDQGLHVRRGMIDLGESKEAIARRMNEEVDEVDAMVDRMALVDLYLHWLGQAGQYHRVGKKDEQSFEELWLRTRRANFKNLAREHQQAVRGAVFSLVKDQRGYKEVRDVADFMIKNLGKFAERVREEAAPELVELLETPVDAAPSREGSGDLLDELAESGRDSELPVAGAELGGLVREPSAGSEVATVLTDVAKDLKDEESEQNNRDAPMRMVKRSLQGLQRVRLSAETPRRNEIARMLDELITTAELLGERVAQLESESEG